MNYRSRRYREACDLPEPYCDPFRSEYYSERPVSWPERPSLSIRDLPGIGLFWPMPLVLPMFRGLGRWWSTGPSYEQQYYLDRRRGMSRYRYYEADQPPARYCERCGYYECRCERCGVCGYYECRCGSYGTRRVDLDVEISDEFKHNYKVELRPEFFPSHALPVCPQLTDPRNNKALPVIPIIHVKPDRVTVKLTLQGNPDIGTYTAQIYDQGANILRPLATLTLYIH